MLGHYVPQTWQYDPVLYAPARYRRACRYDAFVPVPLSSVNIRVSAETAGILSDAEAALHRIDASDRIFAPLARLLLRTESIASAKVEGLQVGVRELAYGEVRAETGGKIGPTVAEVLANIDAMELAVEETAAAGQVTVAHVVDIHRLLMVGAPNAHVAGRIRATQNWIGGNDYNPCDADFVPPPPEHVAPLLEDLCAEVNDVSTPPLLQAALVHAHFETVHPFDDGNGRTGRALIHVVLRRRRVGTTFVVPVSVVFARDRGRYIAGLTSYRHGDIDAWIELFATAAAQAAQLTAAYAAAVSALRQQWQAQLAGAANPRADAAAWAIIDVLPAHPVISAALARAATGRAKAAVHAALDQLTDAGVLRLLTGGRRNRAWEAAGLLDLIADLEDGRPPSLPGS